MTVGLLAAVVALALIFALNATDAPSDWYAVFKIIHVTFAVFWVGGGLLLTALAMRAERAGDPEEIASFARQAAFAGQKLFAPAGLIVLAMGITMVINDHIGFATTWVIIGLVGYALTFTNGMAVLGPLAKKVATLSETVGPTAPETQAAITRILLFARVDFAVLLVVVADMLVKPFS